MRLFLFLLTIISFLSCQDKTDLGNSYYYLDTFEAKDVGFPGGAIIYKGERKLQFDTTIISREVVYATHNNRYIRAKQVATDNTRDTSYYYIDKLRNVVYGPLTLDSSRKRSTLLNTGL